MADIESVINGLECCHQINQTECFKCPYARGNGCTYALMGDVLVLLKAQRPRLMSLQEVLGSSGAIWLEFEAEEGGYYRYGYAFVSCANEHMVEFIVRDGYRPLIQFPRADYLKYWCCWTTQPTQEQRERAKWDGRSR